MSFKVRLPLSELGALVLVAAAAVGALSYCACVPASSARPAAYGAELTDCSETSGTLEESVACENRVRARYGRPARLVFRVADGGAK
jgi:hypothetical protein